MSIFNQFKSGLRKTRDFLSGSIARIAVSMGKVDDEMLEELETSLILADVGGVATAEIMDGLREQIRSGRCTERGEMISVLRHILLDMLGQQRHYQPQRGQLNILLMVGVNGTGKTTTAGKLCLRAHQAGLKVLLAAADTFRAAAIEQLQAWGNRTGTPVVAHQIGSDPAAVVFDAIQASKARGVDMLIIDTAGRLQNKQNLMDELAKIRRIILREAPDAALETLLVLDATTGQNAVQQVRVFREAADVTGLAVTKLDGSAKGGVAIAIAHETRLPILFAGLGERVEDLMDFDPEAFVSALLPEGEMP